MCIVPVHSCIYTLLISTVNKFCLLYLSGGKIAVEFIQHLTEVSGF